MRAALFAIATTATFVLRRSSSPSIHLFTGALRRCAVQSAERAPWISNVRRYASPRLLMPNSTVLPPVDSCLGTKPSQAASCRPFRMRSATGFHANQARGHIAEKLKHLVALELLPQHGLPALIDPVDLEDVLRQIDADCRSHFGTYDAVRGGGVHPIGDG